MSKTGLQKASRTRSIVFCGLIIALMVVSAWATLPFGPVSFTLQVLVMIFALLFLPPKQYFASLLIYLALGAIGLPVFSGMRGGIGVLAGPTGGFLWGFIAGALVAYAVLWIFERALGGDKTSLKHKRLFWVNIAAGASFLIVMYVCGWFQLMIVAGLDPIAAFFVGVVPFVVFDIIKMMVAVLAVDIVNRALPRT